MTISKQTKSIAENRRDLIIRIAADIISESGVDRTTFREIATRAGVSKGVVEHHFKNKADIVHKTLEWVNQQAHKREQRTTRNKKGLSAARARFVSYLPLQPELIREWKIRVHYWSMSFANRDEQIVMGLRFRDGHKRFEADIEEAIELGEVPPGTDAQQVTNMLLHLIAGVSCNRLVDQNNFGRNYQISMVDHLMEQLRNGHL